MKLSFAVTVGLMATLATALPQELPTDVPGNLIESPDPRPAPSTPAPPPEIDSFTPPTKEQQQAAMIAIQERYLYWLAKHSKYNASQAVGGADPVAATASTQPITTSEAVGGADPATAASSTEPTTKTAATTDAKKPGFLSYLLTSVGGAGERDNTAESRSAQAMTTSEAVGGAPPAEAPPPPEATPTTAGTTDEKVYPVKGVMIHRDLSGLT